MAEYDSHNPSYDGPNKEFVPSEYGGYPETDLVTTNVRKQERTLVEEFTEALDGMIELNKLIIAEAETILGNYSLKIEPSSQLEKAQAIEWPVELGAVKGYITYSEYKGLANRLSRGADYIKKAYEDSVRGTSGTHALDILSIIVAIQYEALNMKKFFTDYIGEINDESELKTIEAFKEWTVNALFYSRVFRDILSTGKTYQILPASEVGSVSPEQAAQFQAVFQVKLNGLNIEIVKVLQKLKNDFVTLSDTFYFKFLGPATKLKRGLSPQVPVYDRGSVLGQALGDSLNTISLNLQVLLTDEARRLTLFQNYMANLLSYISDRDTYVSYIKQLSSVGKTPAEKFVATAASSEEVEVFQQIFDRGFSDESLFVSGHDSLDGVDTGVHPLHILKDGDTLRGNLEFESGVLLDGMSPSKHAHTGEDGTERIHGGSIVPGSVSDEVVDVSQTPSQPLSLSTHSKNVKLTTPGVPAIDVVLSWEGSPDVQYEISITEDVQ